MAGKNNSRGAGGSGGAEGTGVGGLRKELAGIAVLAAAAYTAVSIYSYGDGSNWGGVVGEHLSGALVGAVGYTSYIFPVLLAIVSLEFILRRDVSFRATLPVALVVFVAAASALVSSLVITSPSGGILGEVLSRYLTDYLGFTGATIILGAVSLIAFLAATGLSFVYSIARLVRCSVSAAASASEAASEFMERTREARAEREAEREKKAAAQGAPEPKKARKPEKPATPAPPGDSVPQIHNRSYRPEKDEKDEKEHLEFEGPGGEFRLPPVTLLDEVPEKVNTVDSETLIENSRVLTRKLEDFGIQGRVVEVRPGPVVTMYEFEPAPGIKVNKITSLADDIALAMKAMAVRIIAPIPGKSVVGIEVPNLTREVISFREMLRCQSFAKSKSVLSLALGQDISGTPYIADFAKMPHLLVAGATGAGKSVSVNAMILSLLYKATPDQVRFVMVDPKMLELSAYEGIPHLITPVITDPKKAAGALKSIVNEMARRYKLMATRGARNIDKYNQIIEAEIESGTAPPKGADGEEQDRTRLPYIVVVIDELADLMMTSGKEVQECLVRLSQMARAAGIHLLVATQRPSVDVVTGLIKTNFPARIAFQLPSKTDSRTILDAGGAETLLGEGDMLFLPPGSSKLQRVHGVFVSENEIKRVTDFWKKQGSPDYDEVIIEESESYASPGEVDDDLDSEFLQRYDEAVEMASQLEMISTSYIQRRFRIGYNTAARLIEKMEREGVVGSQQGSRPREVLLRKH